MIVKYIFVFASFLLKVSESKIGLEGCRKDNV